MKGIFEDIKALLKFIKSYNGWWDKYKKPLGIFLLGLLVGWSFFFRGVHGKYFGYWDHFTDHVFGVCSVERPKGYLKDLIKGDGFRADICPDVDFIEPPLRVEFRNKVVIPYLRRFNHVDGVTFYPKTVNDGRPDMIYSFAGIYTAIWVKGDAHDPKTSLDLFYAEKIIKAGGIVIFAEPLSWKKVTVLLNDLAKGIGNAKKDR